MKRKLLKIAYIFLIVVVGILLPYSIALAISNPDDLEFGSGSVPLYKVYENVDHEGDMLFIAEALVDYTVEPTDYTAEEAFQFEVQNAAGNETIVATPLNEFGDRPISIYLTSDQVDDLGLVSGTAYILRITGNPLIFASETGNTVEVTLSSSDYVDQELGVNTDPPTSNLLRNFCIDMVDNIQDYDTPTSDYYDMSNGYNYLVNDGINIFIEGVPGLYSFCPVLFGSGSYPVSTDVPESTGAYAATITPLGKWGQTTADGLTNIGVYFGINQALAGSVVLFVLAIMLSIYIYSRTQSGITVLLMVCTTPFVGGFLGLMPMAMAFVFLIIMMVLMGFYFFSRGAL